MVNLIIFGSAKLTILPSRFVEQLGYDAVSKYGPWYYSGYVGGFTKRYEKNLTFTLVRGAGHMVPEDKPGPALQMIEDFIF